MSTNYIHRLLVAALALSAAAVLGGIDGTGYHALLAALPGSSPNVGSIDQNWWGTDIDPGIASSTCFCHWNSEIGHTADVNQDNVVFSASSTLTLPAADLTVAPFSVACGAGTGFDTRKGIDKPLSRTTKIGVDSVPTGCQGLYNHGHAAVVNFLWEMGYDSLKRFIETCPLWPQSWRAFPDLSDCMQELSGRDTSIKWAFADWLKSVLYLNTQDPEYFCACLEVLPLRYPVDSLPGASSRRANVGLSLIYWMLNNTSCDTAYLWSLYQATRAGQLHEWQNDTNAYHLDTTLLTMKQLGLDTLLARHFLYSRAPEQPFETIVSAYGLSSNPFSGSTILSFSLTRTAYAKIDVLDVLGREVWAEADERLRDPGTYAIPISIPNASAGTYYLRITLGTGEVRTIKMVKEGSGR